MSSTDGSSSVFDEPMNSNSLNSSILSFGCDNNTSTHIHKNAEFLTIEPLPPAIQALLKSNQAPLHTHMLQSNLRDAQITLSNLNVFLDSTSTELDPDLTAKRDQLTMMIQSYRNVLHPIRRTPPEVLLEVFSYCIPFVDTMHTLKCRKIDSLNTSLAPWTFGQVCKHWRSIVLECPRLWSSLSVNVDWLLSANRSMGWQQAECRAIYLLSNYLRRSKDCPLTIAVHSFRPLSPIIPVIYSHSGRWSNILLSLHAEDFSLLSMIKGHLPRLKNLHLESSGGWGRDCIVPVIDAFEYAPNLSSIQTHQIPGIATKLLLPWGQITHCLYSFLTGVTVRERESINENNIRVLSQAVNLRHASLSFLGYPRTLSITPLTHHTLSALKMTTINSSNIELITQLLDALTLPSLGTLDIDASSIQGIGYGVHSVVRLVERSNCRLIRLRLSNFETDVDKDPHFRSLLALVPNMESLSLDRFPTSLLNALMVTKDDLKPSLLPRLWHLCVSGPLLDKKQELFVDVVESRVQCTDLNVLSMSSHLDLTDAAQTRLESLDIRLHTFGP
ncbi:hypothetical protein C8R42DRAFT_340289 [Lentinula raphanica]|nr:hypothetical protein C8R42DRAFT_340289 [Lentinula raphanica]